MLKFVKHNYKFGIKGNPAHNDEWAHDLFPEGGFFVEVGACGGVGYSSCCELEKLDWNGICVEPHSVYFSELIKNRKVPCENCCLTDENGETIFLEHGGLSKTVNSFIQQSFHRKAIMNHGVPTIKKTMTLESLLVKHNAPKIIQFLAMDIEGSELTVLKDFPFDKYKILAIALEGNLCSKLLKEKGYMKVNNSWSKANYEFHYRFLS